LYPDTGGDTEMRCAENGIFAPLVGIIGSMQAAEALKVIMEIGENLQGRLLLLDAMSTEWRTIKLNRDPACAVCSVKS
jgi:molybdopterin/thiamine biosynthesis adenylyltransferase